MTGRAGHLLKQGNRPGAPPLAALSQGVITVDVLGEPDSAVLCTRCLPSHAQTRIPR